jgi:D-aminoacyl-tRNA deacylase
MRAVIQRVSEARVDTAGELSARIGPGLLILLGVRTDDSEEDARYLAEKVANLRIFEDSEGKLNLSLLETGGAALSVSNFTLYGDARKGRRPGFTEAANGEVARSLYELFGARLETLGVPVQYGSFGQEMKVSLVNDGPVTLLLDSRKQF